MEKSAYERFRERYESGTIPWDDALPPPELIALAAELRPGRALDLGCGYGRTAIYLAGQGWEVDGIDFVPLAIAEARSRARRVGFSDKVQFHNASVADLHFLQAPYDLAVDVGCLHALRPEERAGYEAGLSRLLRPDAWYLLFARLRDEEATEAPDGPRGIAEETVRQLFSENFRLQKDRHGWTEVEDKPAWKSGWFWFRRR